MVTTIKVLKRKDASSVVVAVVIALILSQLLSAVTGKWAGWLAGIGDTQYYSNSLAGDTWQGQYAYPILWAIVQLVVLEALLWVWAALMASMKK